MSGPSLIFSTIFPVCFRAAAIVCFMSSESQWVRSQQRHHQSCSLATSHRGVPGREETFCQVFRIFSPRLFCFLRSVGRLLVGLGWLSVKSLYPGRLIMTGLRGCLSSYIIITPKLEHRGQSRLSGAGERQTQFWENIIWALSAFLVRAWNILTLLWAIEMRPGAS